MGLLAQAERPGQQPLRGGEAIDALLDILGGAEVQEHGDQLGIDDPLLVAGRVIDADGHPEGLSVADVVPGPHVLEDDFQYHISSSRS